MRARPRARAFLLAAALGGACGRAEPPARPIPPPSDPSPPSGEAGAVLASLERTLCYGACPAYKVTVYADGSVEYVGERYVKLKGRHTGKIGAAEIAAIEAAFEEAKYFELRDAYEKMEVTDNPSVITSYRRGGLTKTVRHYHGDRSAPKSLNTLEDRFDEIVGTERWIGTLQERLEIFRRGDR